MDNSFQKVFTSRLANARTPPAMGRRVDPFAGMPTGDVSLDFSLTRSQATHIALGFLVPVLVQFASVAYVKKFHKKFLASLDAQSRADLGVRIASSVWGTVCGVWASSLVPEALRLGKTVSQRMYASPPIESLEELKCLAAGFFAWDTVVSVMYYDRQYIAHAVVSVVTFLLPQLMPRKGFLQVYAAFFLLWEVTLPFLSLRYIMIKAGKGDTKAFQVINFTGFGIWFSVRFLTGLPVMGMYCYDAYTVFKRGLAKPGYVYAWYAVSCVILQIFNCIWLAAIIKALFRPKSKTKPSADAAAPAAASESKPKSS